MNKTLTINLNGIVFHIDDDAYQTLNAYMADIKAHCTQESDEIADIMADIEARIAELFSDMLAKSKQEVVNMEMVQSVMATMGNPNSFGDDADEAETAHETQPKRKRRRFYRDMDNALLGGVAAGIAAYLGWDVVVVRILLLLVLYFGKGVIIPIYILMWIIAPEAKTAAQKLEMHGEEATIENIKNTFTNAQNKAEDNSFGRKVTRVFRSIGRFCVNILKVVLIAAGVFFGSTALIVICALLIALFGVLFGFGAAFSAFPWSFFGQPFFADGGSWQSIAGMIALILVIGIPLFTLIYGLIRYVRIKRGPSATYVWSALAVWIVAVLTLIGVTCYNWANNADHWIIGWQNMEITDSEDFASSTKVTEVRAIDGFQQLNIAGDINLTLRQDTNTLLTIHTTQRALNDVRTEVRNDVLYIHRGQKWKNDKVEITLSAPCVQTINANAACKINAPEPLRQTQLDMTLSGASKVDMQLEVDSALYVNASGASKLTLAGSVHAAAFDLSGASKLAATQLKVQDMQLNSAGACKAQVWCERDLQIDSSGASTVQYKGNPYISKHHSTGASSLKKLDK